MAFMSGAASGLRRIDWVRFVVDDRDLRAEAVGVGYRLPSTRPIPLSMAARLVAAGTPHVTHVVDRADHPAVPIPDGRAAGR